MYFGGTKPKSDQQLLLLSDYYEVIQIKQEKRN